MRIYEITLDSEDENEELSSITDLKNLAPQIAKVSQLVYDEWDESDIDTYANGGICHLIADEICNLLYSKNIIAATQSSSHEQHVYVVAKVQEGVYQVDIHHSTYEYGGGFTWHKIPDVEFSPNDVIFYRISSDPDEFDSITGEY